MRVSRTTVIPLLLGILVLFLMYLRWMTPTYNTVSTPHLDCQGNEKVYIAFDIEFRSILPAFMHRVVMIKNADFIDEGGRFRVTDAMVGGPGSAAGTYDKRNILEPSPARGYRVKSKTVRLVFEIAQNPTESMPGPYEWVINYSVLGIPRQFRHRSVTTGI